MRYTQQPSNDACPKQFLQPHPMGGGYNQLIHPQLSGKYEADTPNYRPPSAALHLSADYRPRGSSSVSGNGPTKQSRAELNRKEKQRMFKLNERINQLKLMLDEAGVQTKKSKQSVLDNTSHFIETLRSDLVIAEQKAERAERQADSLRALAYHGKGIDRSVFEKAATPRVVVDMNMKTIAFNTAFVRFTGLSELSLRKKKTLRPYICADQVKLEAIMKRLGETKQSVSMLVKGSNASKEEVSVHLVAAMITDDNGKAVNIEFSLVPVEMPPHRHQRPLKQQKGNNGKGSAVAGN